MASRDANMMALPSPSPGANSSSSVMPFDDDAL